MKNVCSNFCFIKSLPVIKFFHKIQNIGVNSNTNIGTARRIRLGNTMSILGISTGLILLYYIYINNWPPGILIIHSFIVVTTFLPPVLNFFGKKVASRISFVLIANISTICLTIVVGPQFNLQYFFFALLGMPYSFFGNELGQKKLWLCLLSMLFFIYLNGHFIVFDPIFQISLSNSDIIRFTNNFMILLMILLQFYFFINESNTYTTDITNKSNALKEKNSQLEHYAYIAAHDLNEPLRTVNSFVDIIKDEYEDLTNENLKTYLTFITDALSSIRWKIDGMLSYSQIGQSGNHQMVDINSLIANIKTEMNELIKQKRVIIRTYSLTSISCLPLEIKQLFKHLISNAIKFQLPDITPEIEITQKETENYWKFCVADKGIGISPKKHKPIFNMFVKLHSSQKYKGHGIGLAFCKKIVLIHKGKIWVDSTPDTGSRFYFTIPKNYIYDK